MWRDERIIVEVAMSERAGPLPKISAARSERRAFIGGSDARTIMGDDEAALSRAELGYRVRAEVPAATAKW